MNKEDLININGIREDLYQAMQIGDITLSSKNSQKLVDFMNYQDKEIERLNNIINEALGIANERFNYYSNHKNNNQEHLEDWGNIFNILLRRDDKE